MIWCKFETLLINVKNKNLKVVLANIITKHVNDFLIGNKMSHDYDFDHLRTDSYTPRISSEPNTPGNHIRPYVNLETRRFHEG